MVTLAIPYLLSHSPSVLVAATTAQTALVIWHATNVRILKKLAHDALVQVYLRKTTATIPCWSPFNLQSPSSHQYRLIPRF